MFRRRSLFFPLLVLAPSATVVGGTHARSSFIRQSVPPPGAVPNDQRLGVTLRVGL